MKGHILFFSAFVFLIVFTIYLYLDYSNMQVRLAEFERQIELCDRQLAELDEAYQITSGPDWEIKWEQYLYSEISGTYPV